MPYFFLMGSRVLYGVEYHRQHCTLHAFKQLGVLHMPFHDDKYPARLGFEPGTSRLQAPVDAEKPSGLARSESGLLNLQLYLNVAHKVNIVNLQIIHKVQHSCIVLIHQKQKQPYKH